MFAKVLVVPAAEFQEGLRGKSQIWFPEIVFQEVIADDFRKYQKKRSAKMESKTFFLVNSLPAKQT